MSQTFASIEASDLEAGMVVRILGQDWTITQIMAYNNKQKGAGVICYLEATNSGTGIHVYDANVTVPSGLCLQVYKD